MVTGHRSVTQSHPKVMYPQQPLGTEGSPVNGGSVPPPTVYSDPCPQNEVGTKGSGDGDTRQGRNARLLSAWPRWGGKQARPGQPLPLQRGVDAGGWVPRTQNKPGFYFQVLLWTLSKVPGEQAGVVRRRKQDWGGLLGVGRGGRRTGRSERAGLDKALGV